MRCAIRALWSRRVAAALWLAALSLVLGGRGAWAAELGKTTFVDGAPGAEYRWTPQITASPAALGAGRVRLLLDWQDVNNTYFCELAGDQAWFGQRMAGQEHRLGLGGPIRRGSGGDVLRLSLQRGEGSFALYVNGVRAAEAEGRAWESGSCGWQTAGEGMTVAAGTLQDLEEVFFADDFMRTDEQLGGWSAALGGWENNQQGSKVSRSANAFSFRSVGGETCLATHGNAYDRDYMVQAAVSSESVGAVGLVVGYQDPQNYYLLRWTSSAHSDGGTARLVRVFEGQRVDLTPPAAGGYQPDTWYKLQLLLSGGWLRAWIDERPLFEVVAQCFGEGLLGLYTEPGEGEVANDSRAGALFDDVVQRSWPLFEETFGQHEGNWRWGDPARWRQGVRGDGLTTLELAADSETWFGAETWTDPALSADGWAESGAVGLALGHGGAGTEYRAWLDGSTATLERVGEAAPLARVPFERQGMGPWRLGLAADGGLLRLTIDGREVATGWAGGPVVGQAGLLTRGAGKAAVSDVRASFRPTFFSLPATLPAEFVEDRYMTAWASPGAAWIQVEGAPQRWHKGFFFGDREVRLTVPELGTQAGRVTIYLGVTDTAQPSGYAVQLSLRKEARTIDLRILRDGAEVASGSAEPEGDQAAVIVALRGGFVVASVDDQPVLAYAVPPADREAQP